MPTITQPNPSDKHLPTWSGLLFDFFLILLILVGVYYRFSWSNWSEGANLHPDEYGLTNTLVQLSVPKSLADYFNTRLSPLSPYEKYDINGQPTQNGPDNAMRWGQWPIIILRVMGEITGNTGYDEIRLMGRHMAALIDCLTLLMIYLIGRKLYNNRVGLTAAALSGLAVMQIQQSHFMTVDMYGVFFSTLAMYFAVCFAQSPVLSRTEQGYRPTRQGWLWGILFGMAFGMTLASRINLLPLAGMIVIAAFISVAKLKLKSQQDLVSIAIWAGLLLSVCGLAAILTFRVTQPMSFRATRGDTTLFTIHPNPEWVNSMTLASQESSGIGGGPPAEQWAARPAIIFPLSNMLLWGMGLPLGLMAWAGFFMAFWQVIRYGRHWEAHLLNLVWVGGYFLFMGTRWVKSIRYFLPIYPFLALLAAWALMELWKNSRSPSSIPASPDSFPINPTRRQQNPVRSGWMIASGLLTAFVLLSTLAWATSFVKAVYVDGHTRIQATLWMVHNIPSPIQLNLETRNGQKDEPISVPDGLQVAKVAPFSQVFTPSTSGVLHSVLLPIASLNPSPSGIATGHAILRIIVAEDGEGQKPLSEADVDISLAPDGKRGQTFTAEFKPIDLRSGQNYYLLAVPQDQAVFNLDRVIISNESWDEGLPVRMQGYDPYSQYFDGISMEARWYDNPDKLKMYLDVLSKADYVIVPSQRAVWSATRLPLTYPMTLDYYRSLFQGQLGFDLIASFNSPFQLGPLYISDLGGTVAWNEKPKLPLFNNSILAAEEAFSVYDHPPVWVFKKRADFDIQKVAKILGSIDLSKVIVVSPKDSTPYNGPQVWIP
jgi:hypothetical protein